MAICRDGNTWTLEPVMADLPVCYEDVVEALPRVRQILKPTPLYEWSGLSELLGCSYFVKHENHQPIGAFKIRGGINLVSTLSDDERNAGILGCSTGNHGQSLAYAARHFGVECTIVVPTGTNPGKTAAIRHLGAKLIEHGRDFDESRSFVESELVQSGFRYVHSANEPKLIAGVGTMAVEIFDDQPEPDFIIVPIGLGSGTASTCLVAKHLRPETRVIGVQAESAPAVAMSWKKGQIDTDYECNTWAEGVATRVPAKMTFKIMKELLDDVILVSDDEMRQAVFWLLEHTHNLAEGAGAATLAAAWKERSQFTGKKVVGVLSGGNLDLNQLPQILEHSRH